MAMKDLGAWKYSYVQKMHTKVNLIYGVSTLLVLQCQKIEKIRFFLESRRFNGI